MGNQEAAAIVESMYANSAEPAWRRAGKDAFDAMKLLIRSTRRITRPGGAQYGQGGELGRNLQQLARLIKADAGVEAAFAEMDGWDHHGNENQARYQRAAPICERHRGLLHTTWATAWRISSW